MQKGDVPVLMVTTTKDTRTKEALCQIQIGKYTMVQLTMEEALVLLESINRVRELYLEQLRRKATNAKVGRSYAPCL